MTVPRRRLGADQRREQITSATVAVLAEAGYQGASVDAIARRAGVSKGLLAHYFSGRDDLMEQTARQTLLTLRAAVADTLDLTAPVPEVIRAAVHGAAALRSTHAAERRALREVIFNLRGDDGELTLTNRDYDDTHASQAAIFRRGQRDGHIRDDLDPDVLAVTYQGAVDAMLDYLDGHPDADPEQHARQVADILLDGVTL